VQYLSVLVFWSHLDIGVASRLTVAGRLTFNFYYEVGFVKD
jgi:hypothetical protein